MGNMMLWLCVVEESVKQRDALISEIQLLKQAAEHQQQELTAAHQSELQQLETELNARNEDTLHRCELYQCIVYWYWYLLLCCCWYCYVSSSSVSMLTSPRFYGAHQHAGNTRSLTSHSWCAQTLTPVWSVWDRGIYVDSDLSMSTCVMRTVTSCFTVMRQIRNIRRSVNQPVLCSLVVSLVLKQLDYGSALLAGLPRHSPAKVQSVLNAAVRLVFLLISTTTWCHYLSCIGYKSERMTFWLAQWWSTPSCSWPSPCDWFWPSETTVISFNSGTDRLTDIAQLHWRPLIFHCCCMFLEQFFTIENWTVSEIVLNRQSSVTQNFVTWPWSFFLLMSCSVSIIITVQHFW